MSAAPPKFPLTVEATVVDGRINLDVPLSIPDNTRVHVTLDTRSAKDRWQDSPLRKVIGIGQGVEDGAEQHDHYIYGTPKK